jgi:hypothetical protein
MSGLRPVAAFFIVFAAIAWIMVAFSVAKTATLSGTPSYRRLERGRTLIPPPPGRALPRPSAPR